MVGRTRYCVEPKWLQGRVETCGGTKNPDLERIVSLAPDLVLMNGEENRREDAEALTTQGLRVAVSTPKTVEDVCRQVVELGELLGLPSRALELATSIANEALRVRKRAQGLASWRFVYLIWRKPWMAAGPETYISALLETAGGLNAVSELGAGPRYPVLDAEQIQQLAPDCVLLSSEPYPFGARQLEELVAVTGLARTRFRFVDGQSCCWHGSRTLDGLKVALEIAETLAAGEAQATNAR